MSLFDRSFSEKRNFIRMKVNTPVSIEHAGKTYTASCLDLSADGMSIETSDSFHLGDELKVSIDQDGENRQSFHAITEVARVSESLDRSTFNVGLYIKEVLP
jgi:hypothetical protein